MTRKGTLCIKICGLQRLADVEAVNRCRPDWAGFVFAPGRHRICPEEARVLRAALRKDIPVFPDHSFIIHHPTVTLCTQRAVCRT